MRGRCDRTFLHPATYLLLLKRSDIWGSQGAVSAAARNGLESGRRA